MKKRTMVMALTAVAVAGALTACGGGTKDNSRDFAFKIKSSPFCQGSIWQNGEFSY